MGIEDDDIARVRDTSDIVAVVSEYTSLKRVGRRWQGLCPFHTEKSGSFSVNQEKGVYYCFGCGVKGDVITFVREKEHLDFVGAVEKLAAKAGVTLRYTDEHQGENRRRRQALSDALGHAVEWYHQRLRKAPDAGAARAYLLSRGLTKDEILHYRLGWAPTGWDELARALALPADVFVDAGLGFRNSRGRLTDAFRGRVLFPIFDVNGHPVGFGGRILPGAEGPKYKNSAESEVYAKSRTLYGLNWTKGEIVNVDEVVVCEGYTDVIGFAAAGVPRAVATCGTALTEDHVKALTGYARRIVLAFDADAAGQNAAARFYEWERRYDADVAVAALPGGVDPADLARSDPEALREAVTHAVPFLGFRLNRVLSSASLDAPEGRARAAGVALDLIREHPNELVRDQYLMQVASMTRIEPDRLRADLARPRPAPVESPRRDGARSPRARSGAAVGAPVAAYPGAPAHPQDGADWGDDGDPGPGGVWATPGSPRGRAVAVDRRPGASRAGGPLTPGAGSPAEVEALRLLVIRPDDLVPWLHDALFGDPAARAAYRGIVAAPDLRAAIDAADPATAELLYRVAAEDTEADPEDVVDLLIMNSARRRLDELQATGGYDDPAAFAAHAADVMWVKLQITQLRERPSREEAREQLLAWLIQESEERE